MIDFNQDNANSDSLKHQQGVKWVALMQKIYTQPQFSIILKTEFADRQYFQTIDTE